jgi:hypothetical protein
VLTSVVDRDGSAFGARAELGPALLDRFAFALCAAGLQLTDCRAASAADVAELRSAWAKRLGIPARRAAWLMAARKPKDLQ